MTLNRQYTSRRMAIVHALVEKLKKIDGSGYFESNVFENVVPKTLYWDDISQYPIITVTPGQELRQYQGGGYKDRYLNITLRIYVNEEDAHLALESLLEDVETVIEDNSRLEYLDKNGASQYTQQITVISIETDEGLLEPYGIAEMLLEVRY
jgi:hypothetical protein